MSRGLRGGVGALLALLALAVAPAAQAKIVTIGSPLTQDFAITGQPPGGGTLVNKTLPEPGALVTSPIDGIVIRWRLYRSYGNFGLRVVRPAGGNTYGFLDPMALSGPVDPGLNVLRAGLPIQAGDTISLNFENGNGVGMAEVKGASHLRWPQQWAPTTEPASEEWDGYEVAFNADVQPLPQLTSITPSAGGIKGGDEVAIRGTDFAGAVSVSFGGTPAQSFREVSENEVIAVAPRGLAAGKVPVIVGTLAGTTALTEAGNYRYEACVVPRLKGKTLKGARKKLRRKGCKLGSVQRAVHLTGPPLRVIRQGRTPGKLLPVGTRVGVTVG